MLAAMALTGLAACSDESEIVAPDQPEVPAELTLTLALPDYYNVGMGSRAESPLQSISVICFDKDNAWLSTQTGTVNDAANGKVTVPLNKKTVTIELVANYNVPATATNMTQEYVSDINANIYWGRAKLATLINSGNKLEMTRNRAKVSVTNSASNFTPTRYRVYGTATMGSVAPVEATEMPNVKEGDPCDKVSALTNIDNEVYLFETAKETGDNPDCRIVIEGTYNTKTYYYPIAFRTRSGSGSSDKPNGYTYTPIDILRNHHYKVNITEVRGAGWNSEAEAKAAKPDNRLTVEIVDDDMAIDDVIADSDNLLGVCNDITVGADITDVPLRIVSTYTTVSLKSETAGTADDWCTVGDKAVSSSKDPASDNLYIFQTSATLTANPKADTRQVTVTVTAGNLTRNIVITQLGRDFMRDPTRPVKILFNGSVFNNDYFTWMDNNLKGVDVNSFYQSGTCRNDGLIFPALQTGVNSNISYRIKALSDDRGYSLTSGDTGSFSVSKNDCGDSYYYTVTANTNNELAVATLTITNGQGIQIPYKLYKTGFIHEMKSSYDSYQPEGHAVETGYYYYEVVKLGSYWTLDRNIGATSNRPYITTNTVLKSTGATACGGYFKIATTKSSSQSSVNTIDLGLGNFRIPTRSELESMDVHTEDVSGYFQLNEACNVACATTADSKIGSRIFYPHAGYYDAEMLRYETHVNMWTKTLVSGNQGFSTSSPEFGYWYLYLDVYTTKTSFSNMRIANGASGSVPDEYSVWKYMSIRPVLQ